MEIAHRPLTAADRPALQILALTVAETIKAKYPDLPMLTPKQVADVLRNKTDRSTVNGIRDRLISGTLIKGLSKTDGRWEVPAADLARVFDNKVDLVGRRKPPPKGAKVSSGGPGSKGKRPWRAKIGERVGIIGFEQQGEFWAEVYGHWDALQAAELEAWRRNLMQMATSRNEGWQQGYEASIRALFDEALATTRRERQAIAKSRRDMAATGDYDACRKALDAAPDTLFMGRSVAMFYLAMSSGVFQANLKKMDHPFVEPRGGATKGEVDGWFIDLVSAKHAAAMDGVTPYKLGRDLSNGRPYLVDSSGTILGDASISSITAEDAAYALNQGAGIRILSLASALDMPWRDANERSIWSQERLRALGVLAGRANAALAEAERQLTDHDTPAAAGGKGKRTGGILRP